MMKDNTVFNNNNNDSKSLMYGPILTINFRPLLLLSLLLLKHSLVFPHCHIHYQN